MKPAGTWDPMLRVTRCTQIDYRIVVMASIADSNFGERGENLTGDCLISVPASRREGISPHCMVNVRGKHKTFQTEHDAISYIRDARNASVKVAV